MPAVDTDLLLVQRGNNPFRESAASFAEYVNGQITIGNGEDIPIASAAQLGAIRVGANLDIDPNTFINCLSNDLATVYTLFILVIVKITAIIPVYLIPGFHSAFGIIPDSPLQFIQFEKIHNRLRHNHHFPTIICHRW